MTAATAKAYAEQVFRDNIEPFAVVSFQTAQLIKERLAHAYMDGGLAVARSLATWKSESTEQSIECGNRESGPFT